MVQKCKSWSITVAPLEEKPQKYKSLIISLDVGTTTLNSFWCRLLCWSAVDVINKFLSRVTSGGTIAQWIRLPLSCSSPGFKSQARHLCFSNNSQILHYICHCIRKRTIFNKKRPSLGHLKMLVLYSEIRHSDWCKTCHMISNVNALLEIREVYIVIS